MILQYNFKTLYSFYLRAGPLGGMPLMDSPARDPNTNQKDIAKEDRSIVSLPWVTNVKVMVTKSKAKIVDDHTSVSNGLKMVKTDRYFLGIGDAITGKSKRVGLEAVTI